MRKRKHDDQEESKNKRSRIVDVEYKLPTLLKKDEIIIVKSNNPLYLQILLGLKVVRAGVVPYSSDKNGLLWLLLGRKKSAKLTDFGGGCKLRKNEYLINCAMREYQEETMNQIVSPFAEGTIDFHMENKTATTFIIGTGAIPWATIFYQYPTDSSIPIDFKSTDEIDGISWYNIDHILYHREMIDPPFRSVILKMWRKSVKVQNFSNWFYNVIT